VVTALWCLLVLRLALIRERALTTPYCGQSGLEALWKASIENPPASVLPTERISEFLRGPPSTVTIALPEAARDGAVVARIRPLCFVPAHTCSALATSARALLRQVDARAHVGLGTAIFVLATRTAAHPRMISAVSAICPSRGCLLRKNPLQGV